MTHDDTDGCRWHSSRCSKKLSMPIVCNGPCPPPRHWHTVSRCTPSPGGARNRSTHCTSEGWNVKHGRCRISTPTFATRFRQLRRRASTSCRSSKNHCRKSSVSVALQLLPGMYNWRRRRVKSCREIVRDSSRRRSHKVSVQGRPAAYKNTATSSNGALSDIPKSLWADGLQK
jgi:hypothetical protein